MVVEEASEGRKLTASLFGYILLNSIPALLAGAHHISDVHA